MTVYRETRIPCETEILSGKDVLPWVREQLEKIPCSMQRAAFLLKVADALRDQGDEILTEAHLANHVLEVPEEEDKELHPEKYWENENFAGFQKNERYSLPKMEDYL